MKVLKFRIDQASTQKHPSPNLQLLGCSNAVVLQTVVLISFEQHPQAELVLQTVEPFDPQKPEANGRGQVLFPHFLFTSMCLLIKCGGEDEGNQVKHSRMNF